MTETPDDASAGPGGSLDGDGMEDGIRWTIRHTAEREFQITVWSATSKRERTYHTVHPTLFGLDVADHQSIEEILDVMICEVRADQA
jgi:hypothetical protein